MYTVTTFSNVTAVDYCRHVCSRLFVSLLVMPLKGGAKAYGEGHGKKRLPRYIPLKNGMWMQLRSKCVVRFHKINQTKDPHEFHFSEMQKYLPFVTEAEL